MINCKRLPQKVLCEKKVKPSVVTPKNGENVFWEVKRRRDEFELMSKLLRTYILNWAKPSKGLKGN